MKNNAGIYKQSNDNTAKQPLKIEYTPGIVVKIIMATLFLIAFGLVMIYSASSYSSSISSNTNYDSAFYAKRQLFNFFVSIPVFVAAVFFNYKWLRKFEWFFYIFAICVLFLLKTPLAIEVKGATRWIVVAGIQIQIADIVKVCLIIFMASFVSNHWKQMHEWKVIVTLWGLMAVQAVAVLLISSNLSTAILLMFMCFTLTFIVSENNKLHIAVLAVGIVVVTIAILVIRKNLPLESELDNYPYQLHRVFAWLDPNRYAKGIGYQVLQSLYAVGSGGLLGKGLGNGTQKLSNIPEAHNDMIFAIICEELGLVGAVLMFLMFGYLLYQMFVVIRESRNLFGSLIVMGVMLQIIYQVLINVCVAVNVMPNTGVPLPFISYGGTALLFSLLEIGLVVGIRRRHVAKKYSKGD